MTRHNIRLLLKGIDVWKELKALVRTQEAALRTQEEEFQKRILELRNKLLWAEEKYKAMANQYFGRKSEKYTAQEDIQNRLFDEAEEHANESAPPIVARIMTHGCDVFRRPSERAQESRLVCPGHIPPRHSLRREP